MLVVIDMVATAPEDKMVNMRVHALFSVAMGCPHSVDCMETRFIKKYTLIEAATHHPFLADPVSSTKCGVFVMPISRANGVDIYYERAGSGPPMLFLHAMPFDHSLWMYQVARYSARYTTITLDLRGWGRSAKPHEAFSLQDMAQDALGVLSDEGILEAPILIGCSVGSKIALTLACEAPDKFPALVVIGGNSGPQDFTKRIADYETAAHNREMPAFHLSHLRHGVAKSWADSSIGAYLLKGFVERGADLDSRSIGRVFEAMQGSNLLDALQACHTPTLVVNGEFDSARAAGERTASLMPNAAHHLMAGAGHCCFMEDPDGFDLVVLDFLRRNGL
jgi:pimeloyl-ACP methyl ester carboxylesterase